MYSPPTVAVEKFIQKPTRRYMKRWRIFNPRPLLVALLTVFVLVTTPLPFTPPPLIFPLGRLFYARTFFLPIPQKSTYVPLLSKNAQNYLLDLVRLRKTPTKIGTTALVPRLLKTLPKILPRILTIRFNIRLRKKRLKEQTVRKRHLNALLNQPTNTVLFNARHSLT